MLKTRLIPVLILRDGRVVQSVNFRHTNVIHWNPVTAVDFFNAWAVDEIVVLDVSRDTRQRAKFYDVVLGLSRKCFVPLTVGGWVTSVDEVRALLRLGADKVVLNTEAFRRPELITECATSFGSQCVVVSIDARRSEALGSEVWIDRGRQATGVAPVDWAKAAEARGAGELFVNSIDHDGARQGYDLALIRSVAEAVEVPVIAFGGVFTWDHLVAGVREGRAEAVAAANIFHYTEHSTKKAKEHMRASGIDVR
jgi:imidazole glycerol-phosphate synthase subunit HisF